MAQCEPDEDRHLAPQARSSVTLNPVGPPLVGAPGLGLAQKAAEIAEEGAAPGAAISGKH